MGWKKRILKYEWLELRGLNVELNGEELYTNISINIDIEY